MAYRRISALEAAEMINDGDMMALSGFTPNGNPKAIFRELSKRAIRLHEQGIEFPPLIRHEDPVFLVRAMVAAGLNGNGNINPYTVIKDIRGIKDSGKTHGCRCGYPSRDPWLTGVKKLICHLLKQFTAALPATALL